MATAYRSSLDNKEGGSGSSSSSNDELDYANQVVRDLKNEDVTSYTTPSRGRLYVHSLKINGPTGVHLAGKEPLAKVNGRTLTTENGCFYFDLNSGVTLEVNSLSNIGIFRIRFIPFKDQTCKYMDWANAVALSTQLYVPQVDGVLWCYDIYNDNLAIDGFEIGGSDNGQPFLMPIKAGISIKFAQFQSYTNSAWFIPYAE